jgi:hypothetical protein
MGWLDHSTNNIILDAVLTDTGRQFLAKNNGSFSITKFALGDDDINYNIIRKYGRTVGREKIEKNTPIFEALTSDSQGQKYRLVSVSNPNLIRLPTLELQSTIGTVESNSSTITLSSNTSQNLNSTTVTISQKISNNEVSIDPELSDTNFIVEIPNLFCSINSQVYNIDSMQRATYIVPGTLVGGKNGYQCSFIITIKPISNSLYQVYGYATDKNAIKSYVRVTGMNSGAVKDITLEIKKSI